MSGRTGGELKEFIILTILLLCLAPIPLYLFTYATPAVGAGESQISVELDRPTYGGNYLTAKVTITDPGANTPESVTDVLGTAVPEVGTSFTAHFTPILPPYPTHAYTQYGVYYTIGSINPSTGKVELATTPTEPETLYEILPTTEEITSLPWSASGAYITLAQPSEIAKLKITVTDIAETTDTETSVTVTITGTSYDPATGKPTESDSEDVSLSASNGDSDTKYTEKYWVSITDISVDGSTGSSGFTLKVEEAATIFLDYTYADYDKISFTVKSLNPEGEVIDTETFTTGYREEVDTEGNPNPDTGIWEKSVELVTSDVDGKVYVVDGGTIVVEYTGSDGAKYTAQASIDLAGPEITDIFPPVVEENTAYTNDTKTWINFTVTDPRGIKVADGEPSVTIAIGSLTEGEDYEVTPEIVEEEDGTLITIKYAIRPLAEEGFGEGSYTITVSASDTLGNEGSKEWNLIIDKTPPGKPTDLTATAGAYRVDLEWSGVSDQPDGGVSSGVAYYEIWRNVTSNPVWPEDYTLVDTVKATKTEYTDYKVVGGYYYTYAVRAVDKAGNPGEPAFATTEEAVYTKILPETRTIELYPGWNLISLPLIPVNSSIEAVLSGMDPDYTEVVEVVWAYDAATSKWHFYSPNVPVSDLTEMVDGKGYWIYLKEPAKLIIEGYEMPPEPGVTPPVYHLYKGWNLIGFKSTEPMPASEYLAGVANKYVIVFGWDNADKSWSTVAFPAGSPAIDENLVPGRGYWIFMLEEGDIVPPLPTGGA